MGVSEAEAREVYLSDLAIDRDEKIKMPFDLPPEKLKEARKYARTGTRKAPVAYKFAKKERKKDPKKEEIIAEIAQFLEKSANFDAENIEIVNSAKIITFKIGDQAYKLDLIATRKPKN